MNISEILELNEKAKEEGKKFLRTRYLVSEIKSELGKHFINPGPENQGFQD